MKTLIDLKNDEVSIIKNINGENDIAARLSALGFLIGTKIKRSQTAPLGDPILFSINDQKICLRAELAKFIEIE